ncbi:MAG: polysaccharide biosynthesis protein [Gemmatimonadetes bacterium]|nr:polysaccharide biosynthesis protein [Gemmatimonadota bacterium]
MRLPPRAIAWAYRHRHVVVLAINLTIFAGAYWLAYYVRFDFGLPPAYREVFLLTLPALVLIKAVVFAYFGLYRGLWRYVSTSDLERILQASVVATLLFIAVVFLWVEARAVPRSVILLDFIFTVGLNGGARFGVRLYRERFRPQRSFETKRKVLVVGAGSAGEQALREILYNPALGLQPVGIVDDDLRKQGGEVHGVRILGRTEELPRLARGYGAEEILIAIPSATGQQIRRIVDLCEGEDVRVKVLPAVGDLITGRVSVRQFREVQIEDLLGRDHIELDQEGIAREITDQVVLVTGAGGSIGSELARQIQRFEPRRLVLLDRNENAVFHIDRELEAKTPDPDRIVPRVGDFRDRELLEEIFEECRPTSIFHAAAYKHVPLMEANVLEAVSNNVLGTVGLMDAARAHGVERFVQISTDKAVRPRNVMGATKRLAELVMIDRHRRGGTKFAAVRFGNVLGSDGSVLPIFRQQLQEGGPITVTDPEVTRYFMTIPEAVQLVIQAGAMGRDGEIFLLDMGEPVRIVELAERLISLSGKKPYDDVDIVYTGLRAGEKLHEDLYAPDEPILPTMHEKILVLGSTTIDVDHLEFYLEAMSRQIETRDVRGLRRTLFKAVSGGKPGRRGSKSMLRSSEG